MGGRRVCCGRENEDRFDGGFVEVVEFDAIEGAVVVVVACETAGAGCGATVVEGARARAEVGVGVEVGAEGCGAEDVADE